MPPPINLYSAPSTILIAQEIDNKCPWRSKRDLRNVERVFKFHAGKRAKAHINFFLRADDGLFEAWCQQIWGDEEGLGAVGKERCEKQALKPGVQGYALAEEVDVIEIWTARK